VRRGSRSRRCPSSSGRGPSRREKQSRGRGWERRGGGGGSRSSDRLHPLLLSSQVHHPQRASVKEPPSPPHCCTATSPAATVTLTLTALAGSHLHLHLHPFSLFLTDDGAAVVRGECEEWKRLHPIREGETRTAPRGPADGPWNDDTVRVSSDRSHLEGSRATVLAWRGE
jgi:hypothetical protein